MQHSAAHIRRALMGAALAGLLLGPGKGARGHMASPTLTERRRARQKWAKRQKQQQRRRTRRH